MAGLSARNNRAIIALKYRQADQVKGIQFCLSDGFLQGKVVGVRPGRVKNEPTRRI